MRYFVIAKKYDCDKKAQVKYIAGEFDLIPFHVLIFSRMLITNIIK